MQSNSNKQSIRSLIFTLFFIIGYNYAHAINEPIVITSPLLGSKDSVKVNYLSTVVDYQALLRLNNPSLFPLIESNSTKILNKVSVGVQEESNFAVQSNFNATIVLHIKKYNQNFILFDEFDSTFIINYDKAVGSKYNSVKYLVFENAYKVEVKIVSINTNGTNSWDITKVIRVDNTMQISRDYVFNCSKKITGISLIYDQEHDELKTIWNDPEIGQTEYDLEWAWVDLSALQDYQTNNQFVEEKLFLNNATRVTITGNSYNIPLLYDGEGKIFVRIRPAQIKLNGQRVEGSWTWKEVNTNSVYSFDFSGHQPKLNWQASTSFAEDGKRKTVVQYFDGTLRNRQIVTKDNTTETTVIAETFYDYQGRPIIQVLPSPSLNKIISYSQNFNKAINFDGYPKWAYDKLLPNASICGNGASPLDISSGTSKYYSTNNELITTNLNIYNVANNIPDAEGYPFTETRLTPDGRVASQSGVGIQHTIGSGHETKYFYETPSQEELDALFGTDVGVASHYFKNIVKDANGQYSVSYTDMHGRTIATALAGKSPINLDSLSSSNNKTVTKELIDSETNRIVGNSIISSKPLVVLKNGSYHFNYQLNPQQLSLLNCNNTSFCFDCSYQLKITVVSECNGLLYEDSLSNFTLGEYINACNADGLVPVSKRFSKIFDLNLVEGSYTINKELKLLKDAQAFFKEKFLAIDTCKTQLDFYNEAYNTLVAQSNCNMTCQECNDAIGNTLTNFRTNYITQVGLVEPISEANEKAIIAAFNNAKANCDRICTPNDDGFANLRSIQKVMLLDVTPPFGQYAKIEEANNKYNIFCPLNWAGQAFPSTNGNTTIPAYKYPLIYNWNSGQPQANSSFLNENGSTVSIMPIGYNAQQFTSQFQTSFANQLLPHHPEFKKLKLSFEALSSTYQFEGTLNRLETWAQMINATSIPGAYVNNILMNDPFFHLNSGSAPGSIFYDDMQQKLNSFVELVATTNNTTTNYGFASMWQIAQSTVFCRNYNNVGGENSQQANCLLTTPITPSVNPNIGCATDWDMVWKMFRSMYLTERGRFIAKYLNLNTEVTNQQLLAQNYTPRFIDVTNDGGSGLNGLDVDNLSTLFNQLSGTTPQNSVPTANNLLNEQFDLTCKGYAATWITQLSYCGILNTRWNNPVTRASDSIWIVDRLVDICKNGSDIDHIVGSSTVNPNLPVTTAYGFSSFPDVIREFLYNNQLITNQGYTSDCNPYLITVPKPFDKQPAFTTSPVITKPSECTCTRITTLLNEYASSLFTGTFSNYLEVKYQSFISQGALDTLIQMCNGTYNCVFLPNPINLPPILQCNQNQTPINTTSACITCDDYLHLKSNFYAEFNFNAPIENPQTETEISWNIAFEHFANNQTGFSKSWIEYVNFGNACNNVTSISCVNLNETLQQFYLSAGYIQNPAGVNCRQAFVNFFNAAYNTFYSYDAWMDIFNSSCGYKPNPCNVRITCTTIKNLVNSFYDTYGVQIYQNSNCNQLFVNYVNSNLQLSLTYAQIQANYNYLCGNNCSLDVQYSSSPSCFLLNKAYDQFIENNNGHPWTLPNCRASFVTFFNDYFGLNNNPWDETQIFAAYDNCITDNDYSCGPKIKNLCTPSITCASLQYIVQIFNNQYAGVSLTNCTETFTIFFNEHMHTNYTYASIEELYVHYCSSLPNICNTSTIDCVALLQFIDYFINYVATPTDINCQENFRIEFNAYFNTNYASFNEIYLLYKTQCDYELNLCGTVYPVINCDNIMTCLQDFSNLYPDPPSQLGSACEATFRAFFNGRFGISSVTGGYTYNTIKNYYLQLCNYNLNICAENTLAITAFANNFNSKYSSLKLPLLVREDLFTYLYNEKFIYSKSANPDVSSFSIDDEQQKIVSNSVSKKDSKELTIIASFADISTLLPANIYNALINSPNLQSVYDPQVLFSMKQVYYLKHPRGVPDKCQTDFTSWFNINMNTTYNESALITHYNNICGGNAGYICNVPDSNEVAIRVSDAIDGPSGISLYQSPTLCGLNTPVFNPIPIDETPCKDLTLIALTTAETNWQLYVDSIRNVFDLAYVNKCMAAKNLESFTVTYETSEYHYTLYYYDQAGNLVKTVPPQGIDDKHGNSLFLNSVKLARASDLPTPVVPNHNLITHYRYNTLNQVVEQQTPDAGISKFYYDRLGRLVLSQNAKQAPLNQYSYTIYDELGRINLVGQLANSTDPINVTRNQNDLNNWLAAASAKQQITRTTYDVNYYNGLSTLSPDPLVQRNLRNRVSYTQYFDTEPAGTEPNKWAGTHNTATYYSYDIHGNVDTLLQDYGNKLVLPNPMNLAENRYKKIAYNYDLISGKVNEVAYQPGFNDAFFHKYSYDAENRIIAVETSTDYITWEKDARYSYYKHGPLARVILGQQQVQGIDYAYTIQGWLKGVNSTAVGNGAFDMGGDGKIGGNNSIIARDAYGFSLSYFMGDYKPINTNTSSFTTITNQLNNAPAETLKVGSDLFNGNIRAMMVNIPALATTNGGAAALLYGYRYDQLNRIKAMNSYNGFDNATNIFGNSNTPNYINDYKERITYDANGNIMSYLRNGAPSVGLPTDMDYLTYEYEPNKNQLRGVRDIGAISNNYPDDIDHQSDQINYKYDAIGNLVQDKAEGIYDPNDYLKPMIEWTVYGKISKITKIKGGVTTVINYTYDASGNRISKAVNVNGVINYTFYVRDATGNVMSVYSKQNDVNAGKLTQTEVHLYGSSRLGVYNLNKDVNNLQNLQIQTQINTFIRGNKFFELSNHLGNVLVTISDKKLGHDAGNGTIDYYTAEVVTANDYYPFGMQMPGRKYTNGTEYRYGFNGQEKSKEIADGLTTAEFWEYDSRIGRRWNVDLIYKNSPYEVFGGNPILYSDPRGLDTVKNWRSATEGSIWGNKVGNSTFWYQLKGNKWQSNGSTTTMDAIVVNSRITSQQTKERFQLAFTALLSNKPTIATLESLLEGTGVHLSAELSSFRFLGPAAAVASLITLQGDNVTPKQRMQEVEQNINSSLQEGDPLKAKKYIDNWNESDRNKNNKIVMRYMSMGEFNARISPDGETSLAPPFNSEGKLSSKYITPDVFISSKNAKTYLALPVAPQIAIWTFEIEILATKSPTGAGIYSKVKPKYKEPGGGREAIIVQPFPIHGFFPLIN